VRRFVLLAFAAGLAASLPLKVLAQTTPAQALPARWDELTASAWPQALEKSAQTCILPIGILEKHGPHAPMGSDIVHVRELAARATKQEYAVIFPEYFYGQINEARHQPGAFALPARLVLDLLDATCDEIGRNGFKRIVILNGHGGNPELIRYFIQTRLERRRNHVVYFYTPARDSAVTEKSAALRRSDPGKDMHAGEAETSTLLYTVPDLVHLEHARDESGADQQRLDLPADLYTAIWWYARFPNHYAGEGDKATRELGQLLVDTQVERIVKALKAVKADKRSLELQNEFFDRVDALAGAKGDTRR
jgi:creatinine amidohydrolase